MYKYACKDCGTIVESSNSFLFCYVCGSDYGTSAETVNRRLTTAPKNIAKENKPKPTLIPFDVLIEYLEPAYREGLLKYERESWRKGFYISDMMDAAFRHQTSFYFFGEDFDPDAAKLGIKKHHISGAIFCLLCVLHSMHTRPELDDRPTKLNGEKENEKEILSNNCNNNNNIFISFFKNITGRLGRKRKQ